MLKDQTFLMQGTSGFAANFVQEIVGIASCSVRLAIEPDAGEDPA
jgi:hypothetical protein